MSGSVCFACHPLWATPELHVTHYGRLLSLTLFPEIIVLSKEKFPAPKKVLVESTTDAGQWPPVWRNPMFWLSFVNTLTVLQVSGGALSGWEVEIVGGHHDSEIQRTQ